MILKAWSSSFFESSPLFSFVFAILFFLGAGRASESAPEDKGEKQKEKPNEKAGRGEEGIRIGLAPEHALTRHGELFRKSKEGDRKAEKEWDVLSTEDRVKALCRVLAFAQAEIRLKALEEMKSLASYPEFGVEAWKAMVNAALEDPESKVKEEALKAILEWRDPRVPGMLVKQLRKPQPEGRQRAVQALREFGGPKVYEAVVEHWREIWGPGPRVHMFVARQQAYLADYEISGDSYDPVVRNFLVGVVLDVKPLLTYADIYVMKMLREITGGDHGKNLDDWRKWWAEEKLKEKETTKKREEP